MDADDSRINSVADELGRLVQSLAAAGKISLSAPPDALLNSIVEAAARIFRAAAASILLVREAEGVLEFKVAYGASDHSLVGSRIPLNQGIAGYVAMSGQPIAISDVVGDVRFNQDFAKSTGYVPKSILAAPLLIGERVIGVMEVLDKIDAASFGMQDMELLGLFARQAAIAIDQAEMAEHLDKVLLAGLMRTAAEASMQVDTLLAAMAQKLELSTERDLSRLAELLSEFSRMGEAERMTALKILSAFAEYHESQRRLHLGTSWR